MSDTKPSKTTKNRRPKSNKRKMSELSSSKEDLPSKKKKKTQQQKEEPETTEETTGEKKNFFTGLLSLVRLGQNDVKTKKSLATSFTPTKSTKEATQALIKQYRTIVSAPNYPKEGFEIEMADENVYKWNIKLNGFEKNTQIFQDLFLYESARSGRDHVLMEAIFPSSWPHKPPFLRVVYPRFHQYTGHITIGGSICVKELTSSGWQQEFDLVGLFIMIRNLLLEGSALIDMDNVHYDYTEEEARSAFDRVAKAHGWTP
eukprot:TRINITY_DN10324_c0_g1_i1.p1 TRINITY_DN10324_c0_g1~~TRINITY_DN10324_c0_g1_i1.p1  ORF type:complete len:259 (+),score=59.75 TRINITY_DN10324_c0_g1_i1:48-824(+)